MLTQQAIDVGLNVLRSKYAKWVICGTIGFVAEHLSGKFYDTYVIKDIDAAES